jgi:ubiquinone/menaquinone biosynthesis C-methylase UbiE
MKERYRLERHLRDFARFSEGGGKDVLEIGVGMGADHVEWARSKPRSLTGIDLTARAVDHTRRRMALYGLDSDVRVADVEALPFVDDSFDIVFSYGVLHHSPDTPRAIAEVCRVLRPGGRAAIMIYHKYSLTGYMLWARYALLRGRPFRSLAEIYASHLESPGTKAYSVNESQQMCECFSNTAISTHLSIGDLLEGSVGQRHSGLLLTVAKKLWPRAILKRVFRAHGLLLLIDARK